MSPPVRRPIKLTMHQTENRSEKCTRREPALTFGGVIHTKNPQKNKIVVFFVPCFHVTQNTVVFVASLCLSQKITAAMRVALARFPLFWLQKPWGDLWTNWRNRLGIWAFHVPKAQVWMVGMGSRRVGRFLDVSLTVFFSCKHISFWSIIYMYILAAKLDIYYNMYMVEYLCCNCYLSLFIVDFHIATQMGEMCWIFVTWFAGCCVADHSLPINPAPPRMYKNLVKNGKTWKNYLHFTGKWNHRSFDLWLDTLKKSKNNNCDVLICLCRFRQSCAEKKKRKKCGQVSTSSSFTVGSADPAPGHIRWVGSFKMR